MEKELLSGLLCWAGVCACLDARGRGLGPELNPEGMGGLVSVTWFGDENKGSTNVSLFQPKMLRLKSTQMDQALLNPSLCQEHTFSCFKERISSLLMTCEAEPFASVLLRNTPPHLSWGFISVAAPDSALLESLPALIAHQRL